MTMRYTRELPKQARLLTTQPDTIPRKREVRARERCSREINIGYIDATDIPDITEHEVARIEILRVERQLVSFNVVCPHDIQPMFFYRHTNKTDTGEELRDSRAGVAFYHFFLRFRARTSVLYVRTHSL